MNSFFPCESIGHGLCIAQKHLSNQTEAIVGEKSRKRGNFPDLPQNPCFGRFSRNLQTAIA